MLRAGTFVSLLLLASACGDSRPILTPRASQASCSTCHGSAEDPAPPRAVSGATATSDPAVGAHQAHVRGDRLRGPLECNECHPARPSLTTPGHSDGVRDLSFGLLATAGGAQPRWNAAAATCSSTYCHGGTLAGGTLAAPRWTLVDGSQIACGSCHGLPPATLSRGGNHPAAPGGLAACARCHPRTVNQDGTINLAAGGHLDGSVEAAGAHPDGWRNPAQHGYAANRGLGACAACHGADLAGGSSGVSCDSCHTGGAAWRSTCTFCHGDAARIVSAPVNRFAPPVGTQGETSTAQVAVGAHQRHLSGSASAAPVSCTECHAVDSIAGLSHVDGQVQLAWGPLSRTGGASPSFAGTTCSASYCHGNFTGGSGATPTWTGPAMTCSSCHGSPPATGQHRRGDHVSAGCGACHGSGYSPSAANPTTHPNGVKNVGGAGSSITSWNPGTRTCAAACHGSERW